MSDILIKCTVCLCATLLLRYVSWSVCVCGWVCTGVFTCMSAPNEGLCAGICPTFQKGVCECQGVQCVQHVNSCWCLAVVQQEKLHIPSFCVCLSLCLVCVRVSLWVCVWVAVCVCFQLSLTGLGALYTEGFLLHPSAWTLKSADLSPAHCEVCNHDLKHAQRHRRSPAGALNTLRTQKGVSALAARLTLLVLCVSRF